MISTTITYYILSDLLIHGHKVNIIEHIPPTPPAGSKARRGGGMSLGPLPQQTGRFFGGNMTAFWVFAILGGLFLAIVLVWLFSILIKGDVF